MKTTNLFILGCYGFFSLGISAAVIGPALPTLSARTGTSLEQLGFIFTALSLGYLSSAPILHVVSPRLGTRNMLVVSPLIVIAAMLLLVFGQTFVMCCAATFLLGLGQSGTQVTYNAIFGSQPEGTNASGVLNRLNAFFGVGALVGPLIAAAGYALYGDAILALLIAAVLAVPLVIGALVFTPLFRQMPKVNAAQADQHASARGVLGSPLMWALITVMGLYVGVEVSFGGWATEFTHRIASLNAASAAASVSAFWAGLALSRYFTDKVVRRIRPVDFVLLIIAVSIVGMSAMLTSRYVPLLAYVGAFLVGIGFGPVYPTLIALGIQRFRNAAQLVASLLTSGGSLGAIFLPALTGYVLQANTSSAWIVLIGMLCLLVVVWLPVRRALSVKSVAVANEQREGVGKIA